MLLFGLCIRAGVETYPPQPIRHQLSVRYVVTETETGTRAKDFGTPAQHAYIENEVRRILAQSGIDVAFQPDQATWTSGYAYAGASSDTGARTTSDLNWIFDNIPGPYYPLDEGIVTVVFCKRTPGWAERGFYQTNGYAFIGWNGVTFFLGDGMLDNNGNMDIVAAVLAHEISHNFGLQHIVNPENLMNPTIHKGYLEKTQSDQILGKRFDVGLLAQTGLPDIKWIDLNHSQFSLHHLRSTSAIELGWSAQLSSGPWGTETTTLEHGIFKTGFKNYGDASSRFFRTRAIGVPEVLTHGVHQTSNPFRARNPHHREGIACGAAGHAGPDTSERISADPNKP
jgi:hypothetical protein